MSNQYQTQDETYGCKHYKRKCLLYSPCCGKVYRCRQCHDDVEDHVMERQKVEVIQCGVCELYQAVHKTCTRCFTDFGKYYCETCRLFDDDLEKDIFHCDKCDVCRLGGVNNFFHCDECGMCINIREEDGGHKCIPQVSRRNCPVCDKDLHSSISTLCAGKCGHLLHLECTQKLFNSEDTKCLLCKEDFF